MADKKISQLPAATTPLAGTEVLPIVQGGTTDQVSVAGLTAGRTVEAANLRLPYSADAEAIFRFSNDYRFGMTNRAADARTLRLFAKAADNDGDVVLAAGNDVEHVRVKGTGDVQVKTGNLVLGTAGKGIDFSANTHAPGRTSELLNWYEEGTWTPTGNNVTFASATGKYARIGRQVTVTFDVTMPSTADTNQCQLQGLPFTVGSGGGASIGYSTNTNVVTFLAGDTGTSINGYLYGGNALSNATYSGARVVGSCTYFV